jgi:hypothetical protein
VIRPLLPHDQRAFLNNEISASQYLDDAYQRELSIARSAFHAALRSRSPRRRRSFVEAEAVHRGDPELQRVFASLADSWSKQLQRLLLASASIVTAAVLLSFVIFLIIAGENAGTLAAIAAMITCVSATIIAVVTRNWTNR